MKNIKNLVYQLCALFLLLPLLSFGQSVQEQYAGFGNVSSVTSLGGGLYTINITGFVGSPRFEINGAWTASDVAAADVIFVDGARHVITLVNSAGGSTMNVRANNVDEGLGVSALTPGSTVAIGREFMGLFPMPRQGDNAGTGIPPSLASSIEIHNMKIMGSLGADYITTDSFVTYTNGATYASIPINKTVFRTTTGSLWRKTSGGMLRVEMDNGEAARTTLFVSNDTLTFNANLNNKVLMTTGNVATAFVANPTNYLSQEIGESFMIGIRAGNVPVTVSFGSLFGRYDGTAFIPMGDITIPDQMTLNMKFRTLAPSVETVVFQYVDGIGGTTNITVKRLPASIFSDKFSPREAEIKKYVADSTITTGTTLVYNPPVIDSRQRHIIRKNENYNAFPAFMRGSKGELFAYVRVGDGHVLNGDAVIYKSTNNGLKWDSVIVRDWTGPTDRYGYGGGAIFERGDTIFVTTQVSHYQLPVSPLLVLDSASSYMQFSVDRGNTFSSPVWITKPWVRSFFFSEGKSCVLPSGRVLMPAYGSNVTDGTLASFGLKVGIIEPAGNFSTITYVDIPNGPGGETETELVWVGGDTVLAFIRQENGQTINRSVSLDAGNTWSTPVEITIGSSYIAAYPHIELLPNRRLILHTRNTLGESWIGYATSDDLGFTWTMYVMEDEALPLGTSYSMYMDFELLSPNIVGAVYAVEAVRGDRKADLKYTTFHVPTQYTYRNDGSKITTLSLGASEVNNPSAILTMATDTLKRYAITGTLTPGYLPYATAAKLIANTGIYFDGTKYLIGSTIEASANKFSILDATTNWNAAGGANRDHALYVKQTVAPSANSSINYSAVGGYQEITGNFNTGSSGLYPNAVKGVALVLSGTGTHSQVIGGDFTAQYVSSTTGTNTNLYGVKGTATAGVGNVLSTYGVWGGGNSGNTALNSYSLYAADARGINNAYGLYIATQNVATNKFGVYQQGTADLNHIFGPTALGGTAAEGRLTRFSINGTFTPSSLAGAWGGLIHLQNGIISDPTTANNQTTAERSIMKISNGIAFASPSFTNYTISDGYGLLVHPPLTSTNTTITRPWGLGVNGNAKFFNKLAVGSVTTPTAQLHLGAGSVTGGTAPLKFEAGVDNGTNEAGAVQWDGTRLKIIQTSGLTKQSFAYLSDIAAGSWVDSATSALDMNSFAITEAKNINGSDLFLVATDSARLEGDNSYLELNTAFTRLNVAGTNVLAWNNTDRTFSQNIPDNIVASYNLGSTDGNSFVQITTTNTAPRMILGSNESGAAIGLQGIQYEEVQAIVASGSFTATKSTISVDLASTGTVNANLTGWPTATTVASILTVINIDAVVSVTVDVTNATWFGGVSPVLTPGQSVNCKLINGVLYIL